MSHGSVFASQLDDPICKCKQPLQILNNVTEWDWTNFLNILYPEYKQTNTKKENRD